MYGQYGKRLGVFDAYESWRDEIQLQEADMRADFPEFLLGPIRKSVYKGYKYTEPKWERYSTVESTQDFREHRIVGLNALQGIGYVGEHGEFPPMGRTERPPAALVVDTYGGEHGISRQLVINDDMGELVRNIPEQMGRAMGRFVARTVVALLESNPTAPDGDPLFSVGRGNDATTALSEDALADATAALDDQEDDDGEPIDGEASVLLVRTRRMELIANRIINSQLTAATATVAMAAGAGANVFDKGTLNVLNGILPSDGVVRDKFLSDDNDWYMFINPDDIPALAVGFLRGQRDPFVGLKNPEVRSAFGAGDDPYTWEFQLLAYLVRHDFGVAIVDPRGVLRRQVP